MVITGTNFFPESKVIFLEKGPGNSYVHTAASHYITTAETSCAVFHDCLTDCIREATMSKTFHVSLGQLYS